MQKDHRFATLFEFDPEIEMTFHRLKRHYQLEERSKEAAPTSSMVGVEEAQRRILRDYVTPGAHNQTPGITIPPVATNNFELKLVLISMVQQSLFGGSPMEDPNLYLSAFWRCVTH